MNLEPPRIATWFVMGLYSSIVIVTQWNTCNGHSHQGFWMFNCLLFSKLIPMKTYKPSCLKDMNKWIDGNFSCLLLFEVNIVSGNFSLLTMQSSSHLCHTFFPTSTHTLKWQIHCTTSTSLMTPEMFKDQISSLAFGHFMKKQIF